MKATVKTRAATRMVPEPGTGIVRVAPFLGGIKNKRTVDLVIFYDDDSERTLKRYAPAEARRLAEEINRCAERAEASVSAKP